MKILTVLLALLGLALLTAVHPDVSFAGSTGTITGITPNNPYGTTTPAQLNNPQEFQSESYSGNGTVNSGSPFKWWGFTINFSPLVSQNFSNPISQFDNVSTGITSINNQPVSFTVNDNNYGLTNSSFNGNGYAFRYHSFNHVISVGNFLPPPVSWILFFVPSFKNKYYYSSSNFNISYVNSSNLAMNTPDANIDGKMQELFIRYYWSPVGVDYPLTLDNNKITIVPYANLGLGGFTDFFYANDFSSNNQQDLLYIALTNSQAADGNYAQGLYGLGLRYGLGVQMFMNNFSADASFHVLPYDFKRGFAAPGFIADNQGASIPNPNMNEHILNIGARYNFAGNLYAGVSYERDTFTVGSIGQTPVSLSGVNVTGGGTGTVNADNYYSGGTISNNYLYISLGYEF